MVSGLILQVLHLTQVLQVFACDELVVVIDGALGVLLELLGEVIQEGAPAWSRTQSLRDSVTQRM